MQISNNAFYVLGNILAKNYDCVSYDEIIQNLLKFNDKNIEKILKII